MIGFDAVLATLFVVCMLGLWFVLMVMGRRESLERPDPAPRWQRRLG